MPSSKIKADSSDQQSGKTHKSIFKEGYVTEACYIVEVLFQKRSEIFNSGKYPENFWNLPKYKGQFTGQIIQANKLLKLYSGQSIIRALNSPKSKGVIKLQDDKLIRIIKEFERDKTETEIVVVEQKAAEVAKPFSRTVNKLKDL